MDFGQFLVIQVKLGMRRGRYEMNGGVSDTEGVVSRRELLPGAFIKLTLFGADIAGYSDILMAPLSRM